MSFEPLFLWVTRSSPHNRLTERRLRSLGHNAIKVPVLEIEPVEQSNPIGRPDAIVFTSGHGVTHHPFRVEWAGLPVFTVGDHTARAARKAGYRDVRSARGDVTDLQKLIVTSLARPAHVVHFSAEQPAGDLRVYLEMSGYEATRQVVYRSTPVNDGDLGRAIGALPGLDGIFVHSPKGARRVAELVAAHRWSGRLFCISEPCAAELRHLPALQIAVAPRPTDDSLIRLVSLASGREPGGRRLTVIDGGKTGRGTIANDNIGRDGASPAPAPDGPEDPPPSAA
jgi:uroporphyrinogen-III synthase